MKREFAAKKGNYLTFGAFSEVFLFLAMNH